MQMKNFPNVLRILFLLCTSVLLIVSALAGTENKVEKLNTVSINGTYSIDGGQPQELTGNTVIDSGSLHTVTVKGCFSSAISENQVLFFHIDNIKVKISINGIEKFSYGRQGSAPSFSKTAGNTWEYIISSGISQSDSVEIVLENIYSNMLSDEFGEFLNDMSFGYGYEIYGMVLQEKMPSMFLGLAILILGIAALIICITAKIFKMPDMELGLALSFWAILGGLWIFIDGGYPYVIVLFKDPFLFNIIDLLQIFMAPAALAFFVYVCVESRNVKKIANILNCITLFLVTAVMVIQLTGLYDLYEMQNIAIIWCLVTAASSIFIIGFEAVVLKNRQTLPLFISFFPLFVSGTIEVLNFYFMFMPSRLMVKYGFALSIILQFIQLIRIMRYKIDNIRKAQRLEYELLQSRIAVMLSQIQPHFLYNTLNDIMVLYRNSPEHAEKALINFTRYLRGNMDSLNCRELIPFAQEMDHVRNYLAIEQMRFGKRLNIRFELDCIEFCLPVLTVQPIVENAIRHGITKKREGGTVTVRSYEAKTAYNIEIFDNGAGFDMGKPKTYGITHNGIENVRIRLKSMCGGTLEISSKKGEGTSVKILIPKELSDEKHD